MCRLIVQFVQLVRWNKLKIMVCLLVSCDLFQSQRSPGGGGGLSSAHCKRPLVERL